MTYCITNGHLDYAILGCYNVSVEAMVFFKRNDVKAMNNFDRKEIGPK